MTMISRLAFVLLVFLWSCGNKPVSLSNPPVVTLGFESANKAKVMARDIASQQCKFVGFLLTDVFDLSRIVLDCNRGMYVLETTQSHVYRDRWNWEFGDTVKFRFSEELLMIPSYIGESKPQDKNPAYYLEPLRN